MLSSKRQQCTRTPSLGPSRYDRVASLLISMLILAGACVAVLVGLWATNRVTVPFEKTDPIGLGVLTARDDGSVESSDFVVPRLSEVPRIGVVEPITELSALLSREAIAAASTIEIEGLPGDPRPRGAQLPPEAVPRWERWEVRYEASDLRGYARQLDFFGVELGAAGQQPLVDYASHFTKSVPETRSGRGSDEKRLYLSWRRGRLQEMDRALLREAGIDVVGRIVLQFYPQKVEDSLAQLEREHVKDGRVDRVRKTIFGVRRADDGYEFFIDDQR